MMRRYYRIDSLRLLDNVCDRTMPKSSSFLKLHLASETMAQQGINSAVKRWVDISGYNNHFYMRSNGNLPNVVRSRWTGQKVVSFTSSDMLEFAGAYFLDPRAAGMTLFMVMDPN